LNFQRTEEEDDDDNANVCSEKTKHVYRGIILEMHKCAVVRTLYRF